MGRRGRQGPGCILGEPFSIGGRETAKYRNFFGEDQRAGRVRKMICSHNHGHSEAYLVCLVRSHFTLHAERLLYDSIPPFLLENTFPAPVPFSPLSFISRFRFGRTPECRRRRVPKVVTFLVSFLSRFGPQHGPQNGPTNSQKKYKQRFHYWICCFLVFGALQVPLGSLLGPSEAVLDGLEPSKNIKN